MSKSSYLAHPIDPTSAERMSTAGLRMQLLDITDTVAYDAWLSATTRGFHGGRPNDERQKATREGIAYRRNTGVWDDASTEELEPVGTVDSWPGRLGIPGGRTIESWAVSMVTVAPTHSGRGIARALLEAELRTAGALDIPMAMLTVSESTLYRRYGFAPAAMAADYEIDTKRVSWSGPIPDGRVEFTSLEVFRDGWAAMHERLVPSLIGEIDVWPLRAAQIAGTSTDDEERAKNLRAIRYLDADGTVAGYAIYRVKGDDHDFTSHTLNVEYLITETPDAYAALWRYLLSVPLVEKVTAQLRSVDEPVRWMITDWRAATAKTWEHQYLRILDVKACLEGRGYLTPGEIVFDVTDDLGFAGGRWQFSIDQDGVGRVSEAAKDSKTPALELGVAELSALYLGGVRATTLLAAGRLRESTPGAAVLADVLMQSEKTPYLSIWY
ncbi:MAG: GNAT family N-acetyltransferase [Pseudolysinimonas sp.]